MARQTFGDVLPANFLSPEEYKIYERLYGPPLDLVRPEDLRVLQPPGYQEQDSKNEDDRLFREDLEGNLEEVEYAPAEPLEQEEEVEVDEGASDPVEVLETDAEEEAMDPPEVLNSKVAREFNARMALFKDIAAANRAQALDAEAAQENAAEEVLAKQYATVSVAERDDDPYEEQESHHRVLDELIEEDDEYPEGDLIRTHPLTAAGRSGTSPSTIELPKSRVVAPIAALLRDAPRKHLKEVAHKTFGGHGLPNSVATPSPTGRSLKQAPVALQASQKYMGDMESNVFLAAIMPGAYASTMNTLVEIRKRLGSKWLRDLMAKDGGPRILDAGAGGAAVQAWRELLLAEWQSMHPDGVPSEKHAPVGKATVVIGSSELRHRASRLLENTTFLPRLPDYNAATDHPTLGQPNPVQPRKQYDIIVAPHTLWGLEKDYTRRQQVQNFWSLLKPDGGILVIIEKGLPRGFELVAAAREMLLKRRIASTQMTDSEAPDDAALLDGPKEPGMIIAPCTNHAQCPMYITAEKTAGRKDYCHFKQRFLRPRYLQTVLGAKEINHEDIRFSYIAVQRGVDQRSQHNIVQGEAASTAALAGYEDAAPIADEDSRKDIENKIAEGPLPHTLGLPRAILPPIKRRGHVVLDLCTPAGRIERWTVPKSFSKQAYRDARKSRWGDLWALGARTAHPRDIRIGRPHRERVKEEDDYGLDEDASGIDDIQHVPGPRPGSRKRTKWRRLPRKRREKLSEVDS